MRKEVIVCDICGSEKNVNTCNITVVHHGGGRESMYLVNNNVDLCPNCYLHVINGNMIYSKNEEGHEKMAFKSNINVFSESPEALHVDLIG